MKNAYAKTATIYTSIARICPDVTIEDASILRRAEITLHRWAEQECGDSNDHASWAIERDEKTGKPFMVRYPHKGESRRSAIHDREAGALKRVRAVCSRLGLHFFQQSDPRGCALYVSNEPLTDSDYTRGVAICA